MLISWRVLFLFGGRKTPVFVWVIFGRLFGKMLPFFLLICRSCVSFGGEGLGGGLEVHESKVRHDIPFS